MYFLSIYGFGRVMRQTAHNCLAGVLIHVPAVHGNEPGMRQFP